MRFLTLLPKLAIALPLGLLTAWGVAIWQANICNPCSRPPPGASSIYLDTENVCRPLLFKVWPAIRSAPLTTSLAWR
jgi:hypothetical protein